MKITQSLIKEVMKQDHCPKQVYYSFVEGIEMIDPSDVMLLGRYFESELLGSCRGGLKQEAIRLSPKSNKPKSNANKKELISYIERKDHNYVTEGKSVKELQDHIKFMPTDESQGAKSKPYQDCDNLIDFAKNVFEVLGLDIRNGESQIEVNTNLLRAAIDHRNIDIKNPSRKANYDLKYTATKEDDRWNGWAYPEGKDDAIIQAAHYTLVSYEETGIWMPFYFLIFGKDKWVKVIQYVFDENSIEQHKSRISHTSAKIREYSENGFKGNGSFNKCNSCPFNTECPDRSNVIDIEIVKI